MKFLRLSLLIFWCFGILNSTLSQSIEINGSISHAYTNDPITDHEVSFMLPPYEIIYSTSTDSSGIFYIELNYDASDSLLVEVSTTDPCTGEVHYAYEYDASEQNFIEFQVCDSVGYECQAAFEYFIANPGDSTFWTNDSIDVEQNAVYFWDYSYGNITNWLWDFGDGNTSTEQNPIHTYENDGEYVVMLSISGPNCESSTLMDVHIGNTDPECMAMFGYDYFNWNDSVFMDSAETDFMTLYFYDYSFGDITNWLWSFGDGESSADRNPSHTYDEAGNYVVSLEVSGETCTSQIAMDVIVGEIQDTIWYPNDCMAMFYPILNNDLNVEFLNESFTNHEASYFWDFGDGASSNEVSPSHQYSEPGEYLVILNMQTVDSCASGFEMYVYVDDYEYQDSLTAFFIPEIIDHTVTFHDMSSGDIWNRYWDFGDGTSSNAANPIHVYSEIGEYTVTLGVGNANAVHTYTVDINLEDGTFVGRFGAGESTAIEKNTSLSNVELYPMPFSDELNIRLSANETASGQLIISNLHGQTVFTKSIELIKGTNTSQIETLVLQKGMYILQIRNNKGILITKKIIK